MNQLFLIVAYDSWADKPIKRVFRTPSEALTFSTTVSDSKCITLQGEDYVTIFNEYLKNEGALL